MRGIGRNGLPFAGRGSHGTKPISELFKSRRPMSALIGIAWISLTSATQADADSACRPGRAMGGRPQVTILGYRISQSPKAALTANGGLLTTNPRLRSLLSSEAKDIVPDRYLRYSCSFAETGTPENELFCAAKTQLGR